MALLSYFSFRQVRVTFQLALASCEHEIKEHTLPEPCASLGRLLLKMGLDGMDYIERDQVNGLALEVLDQRLDQAL